MYSTKALVNGSNTRTESARKQRGLHLASLYHLNKDYKTAQKCVKEFLALHENSAPGYKLLAQIEEALGAHDQALNCYQRSLELDSNQDEVVLRICELICTLPCDPETLRNWSERAERVAPESAIITKLQERIAEAERDPRRTRLENLLQDFNDSRQTADASFMSNNHLGSLNASLNSQCSVNVNTSNCGYMGTPERSDVYLKAVVRSQEKVLKNIALHQEEMTDTNRKILEALTENKACFREFEKQLDGIRSSLSELSLSQKMLREAFDDYANGEMGNEYNEGDECYNEGSHEADVYSNVYPSAPLFSNTSVKGFSFKSGNNVTSEATLSPATLSMKTLPEFNLNINPTTAAPVFSRSATSSLPPVIAAAAGSSPSADGLPSPFTPLGNLSNVPQKETTSTPTSTTAPHAFQIPVPVASQPSTTTYKFGFSSETKSSEMAAPPVSSFRFGETPVPSEGSEKAVFKFGIPATFSGNDSGSKSDNPFAGLFSPEKTFGTSTPSNDGFHFGSAQNFDFMFKGIDGSGKAAKSPKTPNESINEREESPEPCDEEKLQFKPLIPLPPKISLATGEENEVTLFSERAKLFRFVGNEWKERGIGDLKILSDDQNNKVRLLMRRDQVFKVCLNQYITKDLEVKPMEPGKEGTSSEVNVKAFRWSGIDYSEGNPVAEVFAVRFKNCDIARSLLVALAKGKSLLSEVSFEEGQKVDVIANQSQTSVTESQQPDLEIVFEKEAPSKELQARALELQLPPNFFSYLASAPCAGCRGCREEAPPFSGDSVPPVRQEPPAFAFNKKLFGDSNNMSQSASSGSNLFSAAIAAQGNITSSWGTNAKPAWLVEKPKPVFGAPQADHEEGAEDAAPVSEDIYFKPVIALPELVEVKTGEEDEIRVYSQRAKVYRFDPQTKEWKERGVGDLKILKHKNKDRFRLLLRREQIFKIACNHYISASMAFTPMTNSETAVCWQAIDFSEGTSSSENLAVKFKNKAILTEFMDKIEEVKALIAAENSFENVDESEAQGEEEGDEDEEYDDVDDEEEEDEEAEEEEEGDDGEEGVGHTSDSYANRS